MGTPGDILSYNRRAWDRQVAIRNNVDRIAVEPRPETKPRAVTPPSTAAAQPDDLERRLRDVERRVDELVGARSKAK